MMMMMMMMVVVVVAVYADNLECYQSSAASQCDAYWEDLTPWLKNISAYLFYCEPTNPVTRKLKTYDTPIRNTTIVFLFRFYLILFHYYHFLLT